ncbi:MAG TPA: ATP-binding protein [Streptosporangiaceae bacterium]|nr:ATP-binding protein [Streptosporangiaceae bacterium]
MPPSAPASARTPTFRRAYPASASQIRIVRADLRALLDGCPIAAEAILCASELAANAALHSESRKPGGTLTVNVAIRASDYVRIEVDDGGGPWAEPAADADRPHGLGIIATLASRWGITERDTGRTVWAQLDWPAG